jgi:hypothetical protein
MLRHLSLITLTAAFVMPLSAQTPDGWQVRLDYSQSASDPDDTPNLSFKSMGKGFHVTSGPAGTFWHPANAATGAYTAKATFTLLKPSNHVNYYGLVFGGSDLPGASQSYTYFVIGQDGTFQVRQRNGARVQNVQGQTPHNAIKRPAGSGSAANTLEVRVAGDTISYVVNGTIVHTTPRTAARTDGIVGFRVNHMLDVQVDGFEVQKR